jgi:hypothetical protein
MWFAAQSQGWSCYATQHLAAPRNMAASGLSWCGKADTSLKELKKKEAIELRIHKRTIGPCRPGARSPPRYN